jgi:hypothetical protein
MGRSERKYAKINKRKRIDLIRMVELYQLSIKDASAIAGIKYPTAKHIVKAFKDNPSLKGNLRPRKLQIKNYRKPFRHSLVSFKSMVRRCLAHESIKTVSLLGSIDPFVQELEIAAEDMKERIAQCDDVSDRILKPPKQAVPVDTDDYITFDGLNTYSKI